MLKFVVLFCLMALASCGGGNGGSGGMTGTVRVTGSQVPSNFSSTVSFTISYTNPYRNSVGGVPINYVVTVNGTVIDNVATVFNDNGTNTASFTVSYVVPKGAGDTVVKCAANSANLYSSAIQIVGTLSALNVTPATQEFGAGDPVGSVKEYTVSGGSGTYTVDSSDETLVSVSLAGNVLRAQRVAPTGPHSVNILVSDTGTGESVVVTATLVAVAP